jgi:hypothetical protein
MRTKLAFPGGVLSPYRAATCSVACLAFVLLLAVAFWAGVVWLTAGVIHLFAGAF